MRDDARRDMGLYDGTENERCYWCKHPDHGGKVCAVPYTAIDEKGITNSYPCGCSRSTVLGNTDQSTTLLGQYLLRRQAQADKYVRSLGVVSVGVERNAFFAGWDKAIEQVGLMMQTVGGDGRYCVHHDDDPAHTANCYDLIEYITGGTA